MVKVKSQTNLVKRKGSGIYYFRARVPLDLVGLMGKEVIFDSLHTKDIREATALAAARRHEIQQELARVRAQKTIPSGPTRRLFLTDEEIQYVCQAYKAKWLAQDEEMRRLGMSVAAGEQYTEIIEGYQDVIVKAAARGDTTLIAVELQKFLKEIGIELDENGPSYKRLAFEFLKTEADVNHGRLARQQGYVVETPQVSEHALTLDGIVDYWAVQTKARPTTKKAFQSVFQEFKVENPGLMADMVRKAHVVKFRDSLLEKGLAPKTIDKKLSFLKAAYAIALESDMVESNPVAGVKPPKDKRTEKARVPFSLADLKLLFDSPVFALGEIPKGGGGMAAVWLPLLALFSGARLEELAQLKPSDLETVEGLGVYLNITDEGEGRELKTINARRRVPLHPELVRLGFLDYWEEVKKRRREYVFPDLTPDVKGKRSGNWSKWFSRYRREIGIADRRKVFHSFRHGFIDACREASVPTEVRDVLVGHANGSVAAEYGEGKYPLAPLFDAVAKVKYAGLDLSHFKVAARRS